MLIERERVNKNHSTDIERDIGGVHIEDSTQWREEPHIGRVVITRLKLRSIKVNTVLFSGNEDVTMSSREIAELTGKHHRNVTADIRSMMEQLELDVLEYQHIYFDSMNRKQTEYKLDRIHVECLLTGYSVPLRMKVLKRLAETREERKPQCPSSTKLQQPSGSGTSLGKRSGSKDVGN